MADSNEVVLHPRSKINSKSVEERKIEGRRFTFL